VAIVLLLGSLVNPALRIMHVSLLRGTTRALGVRGIRDINENQSRLAAGVTWLSTNSVNKISSLVNDNVVSTAVWQAGEKTSQVLCVAECDWIGGIDIKELG
jgi:hypothetical protein